MRIAVTLIAAIALFPSSSFAQVDFNDQKYAKYGPDATAREANFRNYSFFLEAYRMKSYGDAAKRLNELIQACPEANENFYLYGIKMFRNQMEDAQTDAEKEKYLNEVLRMFDLRAEHFGVKDGAVLKYDLMADKVKELLRNDFAWDKNKDLIIKTANQIAKEAKNDIDLSFYIIYFNTITNKFLEDKLSSEVVLAEYEAISDGIAQSADQAKTEIQKTIDNYLVNSGAATCENLVRLFKPKYEKEPNNIDLIKKIMRYLNAGNCEDAFKTQLAEKYYKLDPSADAAYSLACSFAARREMDKAIIYFKEAISRETNKAQISKYELRLATTYLIAKKNELAASYAKRAIASDPRNGYAQFILAQSYMLGVNDVACSAFDKKAIYWLISSTLEKAKAATSKDAPEMKDITKQLETIKFHFPTMEDIFFKEGMKVGDNYTVNCGWIRGETKVYDPK
ncbi:MAG: hypothetical protein RR550_00260 [Rikenellaceae bacterium]